MHFLFPGFLFALAAVIIPVLIHLFNLRKFRKVYFSNVAFLKEIDQKTSSRRKLKNLLILLARILVIIFLVLAFAKPYFSGGENAVSGTKIISIYLDNSYSMEAVNREGSLFDEAKRRAVEVAKSYGLNDKFQLLTNNFEGRNQQLLSYEDFLKAVDEVKISADTRKLTEIIARQKQVFTGSRNRPKIIYLISDFQQNMFPGRGAIDADSNSAIRLIRLQANHLPNVSVDSAWFISPVHKPGSAEKLVVKLRNNSDAKAADIPIKLFINHQQKAIGSLSLGARKSRNDTLSFSALNAGWQQAEVHIADYPLVFDDNFYFAFNCRPDMEILAINENTPNPYLQAVYQTDPFFRLINTSAGNINYSALSDYPLIIINGLSRISPGLAGQLRDYVKHGGTLMVFPSVSGDISSLASFLQSLHTDIPRQIISGQTRVSKINLSHPVFKGAFEQIPRNIDLPLVNKYIRFSDRSFTNKKDLLGFKDGSSFLSEYKLSKGTIFLCASPLNENAGNFVRHSLFVPVMFQTAFLSLKDSRLFYIVGDDESLEVNKISLPPDQTLKLKKTGFETIPDLRQTETSSRLFIGSQVREPGIYQLFKGDSLLSVIAFNNNRSESLLHYADNSEIKSAFKGNAPQIFTPGKESVQNAIKATDKGIQIWKLCIILALLCLAAEVLLIRFYKITE